MPGRYDPPPSPQFLLWLQARSGNRAVQRLLARRALERAEEQQLIVVSVEPTELEIPPEPGALVTLKHYIFWRWLLRLLFRRWVR